MDLILTQEAIADGTRRTLQLRNIAGEKDVDIFFDLLGTQAPPPDVLDGFVFGVIFYAMRLGQDLNVRGAMSFDAVMNLGEFQDAWRLWKPHLYKKIKIIPEKIVEQAAPKNGKQALAAFSGGVDSIFTLLRHAQKDSGYPLSNILMVHGFDVPLDAAGQLDALQQRTKPLLDDLGLKLLTIRTNLRALNLQDWEDSFMSQLACCLHNYAHDFAYAMVGSSEPYNELILPWGSSPATDYLLSGGTMRLVHDGAGFSRTQKVAQIAKHDVATRAVKVCWQGKDAARNCGKCEKCIRTQLNFMAVGMRHPSCFDTRLDIRAINTIVLRNEAQKNELVSVYEYAKRAGMTGEWVDLLKKRIESYRGPPTKWGTLVRLLRQGEFVTIASKVKEKAAVRLARESA